MKTNNNSAESDPTPNPSEVPPLTPPQPAENAGAGNPPQSEIKDDIYGFDPFEPNKNGSRMWRATQAAKRERFRREAAEQKAEAERKKQSSGDDANNQEDGKTGDQHG
jgi:hypothetical protein